MKKISIAVVALMFLVMGLGTAFAGKGPNGNCNNGAGIFLVYPSTPVSIEGTVVSYTRGSGMLVDTGAGQETVYGIGPVRYWDSQGMDRPEIGETVIIDARSVEFPVDVKIIAVSITIEGQTIQLRDPDSGSPLWRSNREGKRVTSR